MPIHRYKIPYNIMANKFASIFISSLKSSIGLFHSVPWSILALPDHLCPDHLCIDMLITCQHTNGPGISGLGGLIYFIEHNEIIPQNFLG